MVSDNGSIAARIVEEIDRLPPIPANIIELRSATANTDVDFSTIVPLISKDPGLTADILKFANSARYGISHKVDTLEEGVLYLGMSNIAEFVAVSFANNVIRKNYSRIHGLHSYFAHSLEISTNCHKLAIEADMTAREREVYGLLGLLHDIGKLVLAIASDQEALPLIASSPVKMRNIVAKEQDLWGINHCDIGAQICEKWQFPEIFKLGIKNHHKPINDGQFCKEGALVFLAHIISVEGVNEKMVETAVSAENMEQLRLTPGKVLAAAKIDISD